MIKLTNPECYKDYTCEYNTYIYTFTIYISDQHAICSMFGHKPPVLRYNYPRRENNNYLKQTWLHHGYK